MKSNVILVGNGASLLDKKNGEKIDSFDEVLRFNYFDIANFEKFTGQKTTIWSTCYEINNGEWRSTLKYNKIFCFTYIWDITLCKAYKKLLEVIKCCPVEKVTRDNIIEIQNYVDNKDYFCYSSGAVLIWRLLKDHNELTITGFDWWEGREKHHYNDNGKIGNIHNPYIEKIFIDKLLEDRKIKFL